MTGSVLPRTVTAILAAGVGAATGSVLTFTHRQYVATLGGIGIPFGLIGALAIVAALVVGTRLAFGDRVPALAAGAGIVIASALFALPSPSGSGLVLDDGLGYAWALGPAAIVVIAVVWPGASRTTRRRPGPGVPASR